MISAIDNILDNPLVDFALIAGCALIVLLPIYKLINPISSRRYAAKRAPKISHPANVRKHTKPPPPEPMPVFRFDEFDWPRRTGTWRDDPMSEPQRDFIRELGGKPSRNMTKGEASELIDRLIQERDHREWLEQLAEAERSGREKEAAELRQIAAVMRNKPEYKARKGTSKRTQDLREFQYLLARVFADDVIEPVEAREILSWLESRKIESNDFRVAFRLLPAIVSGSAAPVAGDIQSALLDCLRTLRARPTI